MKGFLAKLGEWWGAKTVSEVRRSTCKEYVAWRTSQVHGAFTVNQTDRKVSDQTARRELEVLSSAIGFWDGEHKLTVRPIVWLPEKAETNREALSRSEGAALLWAAMGWQRQEDGSWTRLRQETATNRRHLRRFLLIGFYTGTRSKAIMSLLWEESARQAWVDLDAGMIYRRGREERDHANKRRPVVKIPRRLLAHMRRWREMDRRLEADRRAEQEAAGQKPDFRLVSVIHYGGKPIVGRPRTSFEGCVADARIRPDATPHWLRHSAATWLMEGGADVWDASGYLGMTPQTLMDNYGHHRPDYQAAARTAVAGGKGRA